MADQVTLPEGWVLEPEDEWQARMRSESAAAQAPALPEGWVLEPENEWRERERRESAGAQGINWGGFRQPLQLPETPASVANQASSLHQAQSVIQSEAPATAQPINWSGFRQPLDLPQPVQAPEFVEPPPTPEEFEKTRAILSNLNDRSALLEIWRTASASEKQNILKIAPQVANTMRDERGGFLSRAGHAIQSGVANVSQPIMELIGTGGTDEEIEVVRHFEGLASQNFTPARPDDPWYERGPLQAIEMVPWMATVVGGGGAGSAAGKALGLGAKGVKAAGVAGITTATFPGSYAQSKDDLKAAGVDEVWAKPAAGLMAAAIGAVESIIPNPFVGKVPLTQGVRAAVTRYLGETLKRAPLEAGEEYLQGLISGLGTTVATQLDKDAPDQGYGDALRKAWKEGNEALLPMAFLLGAPAAVGAGVTGARAQRVTSELNSLEGMLEKGFVSTEEGKSKSLSEAEMANRTTRFEAISRRAQTLREVLGEPQDAEVRGEQGGTEEAQSQVEVPTQPTDEVGSEVLARPGMTPEHAAKEAEFGQRIMTPEEEADYQVKLKEWQKTGKWPEAEDERLSREAMSAAEAASPPTEPGGVAEPKPFTPEVSESEPSYARMSDGSTVEIKPGTPEFNYPAAVQARADRNEQGYFRQAHERDLAEIERRKAIIKSGGKIEPPPKKSPIGDTASIDNSEIEGALPKPAPQIGNIRLEDVEKSFPGGQVSAPQDGKEGWDVALQAGQQVKIRMNSGFKVSEDGLNKLEEKYGKKFSPEERERLKQRAGIVGSARIEMEGGESTSPIALIRLNRDLANPKVLSHEAGHVAWKMLWTPDEKKQLVSRYSNPSVPESQQEEEVVRAINADKALRKQTRGKVQEFVQKILDAIGLGGMDANEARALLETEQFWNRGAEATKAPIRKQPKPPKKPVHKAPEIVAEPKATEAASPEATPKPTKRPEIYQSDEYVDALQAKLDEARNRRDWKNVPTDFQTEAVKKLKADLMPFFRGNANEEIKARTTLSKAKSWDEVQKAIDARRRPAPASPAPQEVKATEAGKPVSPASTPATETKAEEEVASPQKHHVAEYGGKSVTIDYVADKKREFKVASQRVRDNLKTGEVGYVTAPDGKRYEISTSSKMAKLVPASQETKAEEEAPPVLKLGMTEEEFVKNSKRVKVGKRYGVGVKGRRFARVEVDGKFMDVVVRESHKDSEETRVAEIRRLAYRKLMPDAEPASKKAQREADEERPDVDTLGMFGGGKRKGARVRPDEIPGVMQAPEAQEQRLQTAKGYRGKSMRQRVQETIGHLKGVFRAQEHIPNTGEFASDNEFFRLMKVAPSSSQDEAIRTTASIVDPLGPKQLALFERLAVMENLSASVELGQPLRFGFESIEDVNAYRDQLRELASRVPEVKKAIETRKKIVRETVEKLIDYKLLPEAALENAETYYHQQVHFYMIAHGMKAGGRPGKKKRAFQKARVQGDELADSEMDYNTSYVEAEASWLSDALHEIEKERLFRELMGRRDIRSELVEQAEEGQSWRELVPEGHDIFQPEPGNVFYRAFTVPEKIVEQLEKNVMADLSKEDIRTVLALGGPKQQFVIPIELANQLRALQKIDAPHGLAAVSDAAMKGWKVWTLLNPERALSYNLRNLTGDLDPVVAADASLLKHTNQAIQELKNYHDGGLQLSEELRAARDLGVIGSGFVAEEVPDISELPVFRRFMSGKKGLTPVKSYFDTVKKYSSFREDVMRYAAFLGYRAQLRQGRVKHYGGSKKAVVDQIKNDMGVDAAAAHLARNLLGDYGNISVAGNWIRRRLMPFWSFQEINLKRTPRLVVNAWEAGGTVRTAGALSVSAARAILMSKIAWMYAAMWIWNNLVMGGDEEDELTFYDRATPHIILGRNADGSIRVFRRVGALGDFLEWFGINEAIAMFRKQQDGQVETGDIVKEMALATPEKLINSLRPDLKGVYEVSTGTSLFPDPFHPRSQRRDEALSAPFGLQDEYKWMRGMVLQDGSTVRKHYWQRMLTGVVDPREAALHEMYSLRNDFLKKKGKPEQGTFPISRYKNARDAAIAEDYDAFTDWKKKFQEERGKKATKDFKNWLKTLDPIHSKLNKHDEKEFENEFLTSEQKERLTVARNYSHELKDLLLTWWKTDEKAK
jgi:hypothetical protein